MKPKVHEHQKNNLRLVSKNIYLPICFLFFSLGITAQIVNVPDANFKARLLAADVNNTIAADANDNAIRIDTNNNGEIEVAEALTVSHLVLYHYPYDLQYSIASIEGIQNFTNLVKLECYGNDLTALPVMNDLVNLTYLDCSSNHLAEINGIENVTSLEVLVVDLNQLTSVNLSNLTNLWAFNCRDNLLSCIDTSGTKVTYMWCNENPNLVNVILQNNTLTSSVPRLSPTIPPPLPYLNFTSDPNLSQICYDNGELDAVMQGFFGETTTANITTNCVSFDCESLADTTTAVSQFTLFPNPTSGIINIQMSGKQSIKKASINNLLGQTILTFGNSPLLDVSSLTSGTYFVKVETDNGKATQKMIKL